MVVQRKHLAGLALGGLLLIGGLMALLGGIPTPGIRDPRIVDAAEKQDMTAVRTLLEQGIDPNSQSDGGTALHWAVHWNDIATAEVLIGEGADVDAADKSGATPCRSPEPTPMPRWSRPCWTVGRTPTPRQVWARPP